MNDFTVIKQAKLSPYANPNCHISSTPEEMLKLFTDGLPIVTNVVIAVKFCQKML